LKGEEKNNSIYIIIAFNLFFTHKILKSKNKEMQPSQQKIKAKKVQRNILAETAMDQLLIYTQKNQFHFMDNIPRSKGFFMN